MHETGSSGKECRGRALVVGAGVSGCACAATLAAAGVRVLVVGAALDGTGLPDGGPVLASGRGAAGRAEAVLGLLPAGLQGAWRRAALCSEDGSVVAVDRRLVSIESKHSLERMAGLEFRQGIVRDIRMARSEAGQGPEAGLGAIEAETVFGEVFEAEAVVVAVGVGLKAEESSKGAETEGDMCSGAAGSSLRRALEELGCSWGEATKSVGARIRVSGGTGTTEPPGYWMAGLREVVGSAAKGRVESLALGRQGHGSEEGTDGAAPGAAGGGPAATEPPLGGNANESMGQSEDECQPESPYEEVGLWADEVLVERLPGGRVAPLACADGVATGEISLAPGLGGRLLKGFGPGSEGAPAIRLSRAERRDTGLVAIGLESDGRLAAARDKGAAVWLSGRVAGAGDYLESIESGVQTGVAVAALLR